MHIILSSYFKSVDINLINLAIDFRHQVAGEIKFVLKKKNCFFVFLVVVKRTSFSTK